LINADWRDFQRTPARDEMRGNAILIREYLGILDQSGWEETVRKILFDTKTGRQTEPLSRDVLWKHGYPPALIEVDPVLVTLHGWTEHKTMTEDSRKMLKSMERVARKWGGHPNEWFVSYESVPLTKYLSPIEYWNGEKWVASHALHNHLHCIEAID